MTSSFDPAPFEAEFASDQRAAYKLVDRWLRDAKQRRDRPLLEAMLPTVKALTAQVTDPTQYERWRLLVHAIEQNIAYLARVQSPVIPGQPPGVAAATVPSGLPLWVKVCAGAAGATFVSAFLPWYSIFGLNRSGVANDGAVTLVLALAAGAMLLAFRRWRVATLIVQSIAAVLVALTGIADLDRTAAFGLYFTVLAGLAWCGGVVLGWRWKPATAAAPAPAPTVAAPVAHVQREPAATVAAPVAHVQPEPSDAALVDLSAAPAPDAPAG